MSARAVLLTITVAIVLSMLWPFNIDAGRYMPDLPILHTGKSGGGDGLYTMWSGEHNATRELDTDVDTAYQEVKKELAGRGWKESPNVAPVYTWAWLPGPQKLLGYRHSFTRHFLGVHMGVMVGPSMRRQSSKASIYRIATANYIRPVWTNFLR
jgi:hypothetical protein